MRVNVVSLTVNEVSDHGPHNWHTVAWMGHEHKLNLSPDSRSSSSSKTRRLTRWCLHHPAARTSHEADGHASVLPVEHRYNIHTGQREVG